MLRRIGHVAYQLQLPAHLHIHDVFHISLLCAYAGEPPVCPPLDIIAGEPEYEIEQLLRHRFVCRQLQLLVLWRGYPPSEATWEPAQSLGHAETLLRRYALQHQFQLPRFEDETPPTPG